MKLSTSDRLLRQHARPQRPRVWPARIATTLTCATFAWALRETLSLHDPGLLQFVALAFVFVMAIEGVVDLAITTHGRD